MRITNAKFSRPGQRAMLLLDCIVYLGLFFIVVGLGFDLFLTCWDNATGFRRNADEIVGTVRVGERWREEIRTATAKVRSEESTNGVVLHIPQQHEEISYRYFAGTLWRRAGGSGGWTQILSGVATSRMETDKRAHVTAWRWEVELAAHRRAARVRPLFTFEAVPPHQE